MSDDEPDEAPGPQPRKRRTAGFIALGMVAWALWLHDGNTTAHRSASTVIEGKQGK